MDSMARGNKAGSRLYIWLFLLSLVFYILARIAPLKDVNALTKDMIAASRLMAQASEAVSDCRRQNGSGLDYKSDPNLTGLIGREYSEITTSLGQLEAKRTATNPNFAGLVVMLLKKAGVKRRDTIAVGASSSFPALIIAVLSAAEAMELNPLLICSLGASQWGANDPHFHWLKIQNCLDAKGIFEVKPVALSLGGDRDTGDNMLPAGRSILLEAVKESGLLFIEEPDLKINVEKKMQIYDKAAAKAEIQAFINIGGSESNMGTDEEILKVKPGITDIHNFPPPEKRGLIFAMAYRGIPVIHLLFMRGLAEEYGLPWDPVPLPQPGEGELYQHIRENSKWFFFLGIAYLLLIICVLIFRRKWKYG